MDTGMSNYSEAQGRRVGELNGKWAFLFKVTQLLVPVFTVAALPWCVWVTNTINSHEIQFAKILAWQATAATTDHEALRMKIKAEVATEMVDRLASKIEDQSKAIIRLEETVKRLQSDKRAQVNATPNMLTPDGFGGYWSVYTK